MSLSRYEIKINGLVQGIGFRPFIYQLAHKLNINGWINNSSEGVTIQIECSPETLNLFIAKIKQEKPQQSYIENLVISSLNFVGYKSFIIRDSQKENKPISASILPDLSTCNDCIKELFDCQNRRYRYPFINCTNCGCRYSIIKKIPYDRIFTTMSKFEMCEECEKEYKNPLDRRFHAQPNACEKCGPHLELWNQKGEILAKFDQALQTTCELIKQGKILAIKGLGGFHLVIDSRNKLAVNKLRQLKNRPDKPFALMYPNLDKITQDCYVSSLEKKILLSSASPIVLLRRKKENSLSLICSEIAPNNPYLGIMLPYTPLHHLLLAELNFPIVATSGNRHSEPICIDETEALVKLNSIADYFLVHNRPIFSPIDDSIVRVIDNQVIILRCARGYAPLSITLKNQNIARDKNILALGGHLKSAIALKIDNKVFLSQYLGNLDNLENEELLDNTTKKLNNIYQIKPDLITCDLHPDYYSTKYTETIIDKFHKEGKLSKNEDRKNSISLVKVQHHIAHIYSVIAEHNLNLPLLAIAWDGTGYGLDKTIWGGEFFLITEEKIQRIATFSPFPLLGGERAIIEPKRITLALLSQTFKAENNLDTIINKLKINQYFCSQELAVLKKMLAKQINSPLTSSVGRLFDGISCLLKPKEIITFEGQAAMALEYLTNDIITTETYPFSWQYNADKCNYIYWESIVRNIVKEYLENQSINDISVKFHQTLVKVISTVAEKVRLKNIVLAGGCFQNKYLLENTIHSLRKNNFQVYYSKKVPTNDGGLALGQILFSLSPNSIKF
ncbi:carbamoyltransferase HypF [Cyanobacterium aponinum UTEX 3221]|uniref:carbamoyltransferase HypF n=1 Tax=Cyanobacterium aponinum TaxID=379064 RepID=UPI002B4BEDAA|nr:carbamoyltransferase HypF [Cyanobacterium aponinum]WRL39787.1 carbamoyltransferase HypF [Cyanobacterium aponinum UTEX 3221]